MGDEAFRDGEYGKAGKYYHAAFVIDGVDTKELRNICAECMKLQAFIKKHTDSGDKEQLTACMKRLAELNPDDRNAREYLNSLAASSASGNTVTAITVPIPGQDAPFIDGVGRVEKVYNEFDEQFMLFYVDPCMEEMSYTDALRFCSRLNAGGGTGWRLPSSEELQYYLRDYPSDKGTLFWISYKDVIVNEHTIDYYDENTNSRYNPCIDGRKLVVHPYKVNSRGDVVAGQFMKHRFIPVKYEK